MASLVLTIRETLRYRGAIGQWSWVLHRITGLGVVLFLTLHVIDTSWAVFYPELYEKAIAIYQSPLFTVGEFALVACVVYHAFNGLRIAIFDFKPQWWKYQERAALAVLGATVVVLVPVFLLMFSHVIKHYSAPDVEILPLTEVLREQIPFAIGMGVAAIAAVLLSGLYGLVAGKAEDKEMPSRLERFWWSFMRVSGLVIVPLVFGHLAAMHVVQGVFDLTVAGAAIVGVPPNEAGPLLLNGINDSGTAVEFVAERWSFALSGVYIWRLFDVALLALVTVHGFNGLRYVLSDYTMSMPLLRRAVGYLCVIGAVVLLVVGGAALISGVPATAVEMLESAMRR